MISQNSKCGNNKETIRQGLKHLRLSGYKSILLESLQLPQKREHLSFSH